MEMRPGARVWLPCEVKSGPFSNERLVKVISEAGEAVAFVPVCHLREPVESGETSVLSVVVETNDETFRAKILGHAIDTGMFLGELAGVSKVDPVAA